MGGMLRPSPHNSHLLNIINDIEIYSVGDNGKFPFLKTSTCDIGLPHCQPRNENLILPIELAAFARGL